ncbi:MAG: D-glycero-beta-D-manno-heptose-7-phosphate kinase [Elusimicrobia bacterium]|nr:D-glycero-beta-D-manno-heptose-7-phosphate kinase [Elusimicrobiota bacterium]
MKLLNLIHKFKTKKILVVGDVMLDKFVWGRVSRISPEAPVPVVEVTKETETLGAGANVASNIASLGGNAVLVSVIGQDVYGNALLGMLDQQHVNSDFMVTDKSRPTLSKTRVIATNQQVVRVDREIKGSFATQTQNKLLQNLETAIAGVDGVIISDYGKGVINTTVLKKVIMLANKKGIPVTVDPKIENFKKYKKITTMTPNAKEAVEGMSAGKAETEQDIAKLGLRILKLLDSKSLLITRGEKGMTLFEPGGKVTTIPTRAKEVYDVTGAGDTVIATMTLALACGASYLTAAEIANFAAGIVVGKIGTATASTQELEKTIMEFYQK